MHTYTRSEFLGIGAASLAGRRLGADGLPVPSAPRPDRSAAPELVVINARIYTVDDDLPRAEALAVTHGRFIAVGRTADVRNLAGRGTTVIDAAGMTVTPGFIDAHSHPAWGGITELVEVNLDLRSIREIQDALRARAAKTLPGQWVLGFKYDDTKVRDGRKITRQDLDEAVPDHPVRVVHRGGHTQWYNSKAFALAGVTAATPDPPGGKIYREGGELTGLVAERASELFADHIPSGTTPEQRRAGVALISKLMTAAGLTTVHDAGCTSEYARAYQAAYLAGELRFRAYLMLVPEAFRAVVAAGFVTGLGDHGLRVGGVKYGADGSASERTMRMSTPYVGRPDDYGILTMTQDAIDAAVNEAHRAGFQVGIHANGDVAIDMVLGAYERAQRRWPRPDPRHRIEHCSLVNPDLLRRIKAAGAIPTPFYTYAHYHGNKWVEYGPEKMRWMFAHRSFLDYGIPVAAASDYIPGPYEPMMALQSMVTRMDFEGRVWGPNQRVTVDEAIRICTLNGARASFEEREKGSITTGKLADFVMLGEDPHDVEPQRLKEIPIARTVIGGKTVFEG